VKTGTKLLVNGYTNECSTFEEPQLSTEAQLRQCARSAPTPAHAPRVTLDGKQLPTVGTYTGLLHVTMPHDNVLKALGLTVEDGATGQSVGFGFVALVHPLTPGTHTIVIGGSAPAMTIIHVVPGN